MNTQLHLAWGITWRIMMWGLLLGAVLGALFGGLLAFVTGFIVGGVAGGVFGLLLGCADGLLLAALSCLFAAAPGLAGRYRLVLCAISSLIGGGGMLLFGLLNIWPMSSLMMPLSTALGPALLAAAAACLAADRAAAWAIYYNFVPATRRGA